MMHNANRTAALVAGLLAILIVPLTHAQTYINSNRSDDLSNISDRPYNIKLGQLQLDFVGHVGATYDDNTNRSKDRVDATYGNIGLDTGLYLPITPDFSFNAKFGLAYDWILGGQGTEGVSLAADQAGTFGMDVRVGDNGLFSVIDTMSISANSTEIAGRDNTSDLRLFHNDFALQYKVDLSPLYRLALRTGRRDTLSTNSKYREFNRYDYYESLRFDYIVNPSTTLYTYGNADQVSYKVSQQNNDFDSWEVGVGLDQKLTDVTTFSTSIGYRELAFDNSNDDGQPAITDANENSRALTFMAGLRNQLTAHLSHQLSYHYAQNDSNRVGINYSRDNTTQYKLQWDFAEDWWLDYAATWVRSSEAGAYGETYNLYVNTAKLNYRINSKQFVTAGYERTDKNSREPTVGGVRIGGDRDYHRNVFSLNYSYVF